MDHAQEQADEREALQSIFLDEYEGMCVLPAPCGLRSLAQRHRIHYYCCAEVSPSRFQIAIASDEGEFEGVAYRCKRSGYLWLFVSHIYGR